MQKYDQNYADILVYIVLYMLEKHAGIPIGL